MPGVDEYGVPESTLVDNVSSIKITTPAGDLAKLTPDIITNEVVISVTKAVTKKSSTWKEVAAVMSKVYGTDMAHQSIRTSFKDVEKRGKKFRDMGAREQHMQQIYTPPKTIGKRKMFSMSDVIEVEDPVPKRSRIEPLEQVAIDIGTENAELRLSIERLIEKNEELQQDTTKTIGGLNAEIKTLCAELESLKARQNAELERVQDLCSAEIRRLKQRHITENERLKQENTNLSNSLNTTKQRLTLVYKTVGKVKTPKHVIQGIKRKNLSLSKWRSESRKWKRIAKKGEACKSRVQTKSDKLKSLQTQKSNKKCRAKKKGRISVAKVDTNMLKESLLNTIDIVKKQSQDLHYVTNKLFTAEEKLDDAQSTKIPTRDPQHKGRINPAFKEASMLLQGIGVAEHEVGPAINTVITTLTPATLDGKLPSKSSQQRIGGEMAAVAKQHLKEVLANEQHMTIKYDATTKNGHHIVEVEVETKKNTYLVGGRETAGGKACDYVDVVTSILDEVDTNMLNRISNTMTDRVITNKAVDRGLEEVKGGKLNSFRCAMHPLDTIHKSCDKFVKAHELTLGFEPNSNSKLPFQKGGESRTQAALRSVDKLFHDSGCGLPQDLPQFLKSRGVKGGENSTLYPRWVGNRFNIYFVNAGLLYMYDGLIQEFQTKVIKPRNHLHHAVYNVMSLGKLQPILRALGIVNKYLTGPWMDWQGTRQNILQTSQVFTSVLNTLDGIKASELVCGFDKTAFGTDPKRDEKHNVLTTSTEQDAETAKVLSGLLHEITVVMRRQLEDHLPGGKYHSPDEDLQKVAESCTSNNISGERVFAIVDSRMQKAKSATIQKCMNKSQFKINKVPLYLATKTKEERAEIMKDATYQAGRNRIKEKKQKEDLQTAMRRRLEESRVEIERKEQNGREAKEKIIEGVLKYGLWGTEEGILNGIEPLRKTPALAALKDQIRFRLIILGCTHPEEKRIMFSKTSQQELQKYLNELIHVPVPEERAEIGQIVSNPSVIVGFNFNQKWSEGGVDTMCRGSILKLANPEARNAAEYECLFDGEEMSTFQTISEIITDIAVGDMFLYIS